MKITALVVLSISLIIACSSPTENVAAQAGSTVTTQQPTITYGELKHVPRFAYNYEPQSDISTFELAMLVPMFVGYNHANDAILFGNRAGGCYSGVDAFMLADSEIEKLGTAARHLRRCSLHLS